MKLEALDLQQVQEVRKWRNEEPQFLRTPYRITQEMQEEFFNNVINDRDSKHRYFAIMGEEKEHLTEVERIEGDNYWLGSQQLIKTREFIGMGGLTNIEWENGCAEISLIINPKYRGKGYGKQAVDLILDEAFKSMRLYSVYGEVYTCGNIAFWKKVVNKHNGYNTFLLDRKFYKGKSHDSMWFSMKG